MAKSIVHFVLGFIEDGSNKNGANKQMTNGTTWTST